MSRARNIKPGFFKNDILAECDPLARILFQGLWCEADREGRLEDRPKRLKAECLPYDDCDLQTLLAQLEARGFIVRYVIDGNAYIAIVNFTKHQNPHIKEAESTIPAPCKPGASTEVAGLIPDSLLLIPDSPPAKAGPVSLAAFLEACEAKGEKAIPADDPIFAYAEKVGLPSHFVALAWAWFKRARADKRYKDWRAHFRDAVRGNWPKYWYAEGDGWALTTTGKQALREFGP